ncbi:MAG: hypothetical protein QFB86_04605 [Patescibacteria group bacterium]|nr:hypothetical protein [Patescibacteria group bacterium]
MSTPTIQTDPQAELQSPTQPAGVADVQTFSSQAPLSSNQFDQISESKPSKWRYFFIVLGILQAVGVGIFFLVMMLAIQQAKAGVSGTEFIGLIVFAILVPAVGLVALINLVGLPIYMRKHKPHGKGMNLCILSLLVSGLLALFGAVIVYLFLVAIPMQEKQFSQQLDQKIQAHQQQFNADNAKPEITKDEAIQLLQSCQLSGFYYTNQNQTDKSGGEWGELSSTGVVLTKIDGKPYRISIADRLVPELVPIARNAQKTCPNLQFWHDGRYE